MTGKEASLLRNDSVLVFAEIVEIVGLAVFYGNECGKTNDNRHYRAEDKQDERYGRTGFFGF
jgi:hypothetical protein